MTAAMREQRVTESDVHAALRQRGLTSAEQVLAVVLESDGSLSVVDINRETGAAIAALPDRVDQ